MSKRHTMRANPRLLAGAVCAVVSLVILPTGGITQTQAQASAPPVDELVRWLDQQETQWVATVHLQRLPRRRDSTAARARPRRAGTSRPMDACAPRARQDWRASDSRHRRPAGRDPPANDRQETSETYGLIKVLGAIGPPAIPALVQLTEKTPGLIFHTFGGDQEHGAASGDALRPDPRSLDLLEAGRRSLRAVRARSRATIAAHPGGAGRL